MVRPHPASHEPCLFRIRLSDVIARLGVSLDDLRRWHDGGWLSFTATMSEEVNEFDDPKVFEIQMVRDIARSGLSDAQIETLLSQLPKPYAFNPDRIAYSFRHGWIQVAPPVEIPDPSEVIEEHLDGWIEQCDGETLEALRDKVKEAILAVEDNDSVS